MIYLLVISFCFIIALLVTPYVMKLAYFTKAVDQPNKRKVHHRIMPRMGGLAIYIAFLLGYMTFRVKGYALNYDEIAFIDAYFIASFLIVMTGMLDDMFELPAKPKALIQLVAALIMVLYGKFMISKIYLPFLPVIDLGWLGILVTIVWIVGITNSINLIDGLDGLSSGISAISFGTMAVLAAYQGELFVAIMSCLLLGSTLGFLVHNFHPAKIFMGDMGSLALGASLAAVSLLEHHEWSLLLIGIVYVCETASVMMQVASFKLTGKRIFKMTPIHHHFEMSGWSEWKIDIVFWIVGLVASIIAVASILIFNI